MKYKTRSADILNEADRFEGILNFMVFTAEQEARLWSGGEDGWTPGDPLPMQEVDPAFELDLDQPFSHEDFVLHNAPHVNNFKYFNIRCDDCEVSWLGPEPCWMCGKADYYEDVRSWLKEKMMRMLFEEMGDPVVPRQVRMVHEPDNEPRTTMRGLSSRNSMFDEWPSEMEDMTFPSGWFFGFDGSRGVDVETNSAGQIIAYTALDAISTRYLHWNLPRALGRNEFNDWFTVSNHGDATLRVGDRPASCDQPFGSELYNPWEDELDYRDAGWVRSQLPRDLDLSVRPAIDPPVVNWPNPTLERYLTNPDRAWVDRSATEQRRS